MYADQLEPQTIPIDSIFLDPNNPRFWTDQAGREVPDRRVPDERVQSKARERINAPRFGIDDLYNSILRNGFLPLDRIVVRPLEGLDGQFVIVEGNRRFAALTRLRQSIAEGLIDEEGIDEDYLEKLLADTEQLEVLVYEGQEGSDISWMLQGIRHISGIKDWSPAQRARLVAAQIDDNGLAFRAAGQRFGLSATMVGRLYRAYKGLQQMRDDEEFGDKAKNEYYTLFEEAYRNGTVRAWLGWDDQEHRFTNDQNLKRFYAWITPNEEAEEGQEPRRIHDPRQIKELAHLIDNNRTALLAQVDLHELTVSQAYERQRDTPMVEDWREMLDEVAHLLVAAVPHAVNGDELDAFLDGLVAVQLRLDTARAMAEGARNV
jgi:hypothetical protein